MRQKLPVKNRTQIVLYSSMINYLQHIHDLISRDLTCPDYLTDKTQFTYSMILNTKTLYRTTVIS